MASTRWRINRSRATYQNLDGEVIIVDLVNGYYFSLQHAGANIWDALEQEPTLPQMTGAFDGDEQKISASIESLLGQMQQYELVESFQSDTTGERSLPGSRIAWSEPDFQAYSDMQNLLLADPIHDVDTAGWPHLNGKSTE
ncbi:hypothetical protein BH09SUM1_BH09SUM1_13320 [soil metagenome]